MWQFCYSCKKFNAFPVGELWSVPSPGFWAALRLLWPTEHGGSDAHSWSPTLTTWGCLAGGVPCGSSGLRYQLNTSFTYASPGPRWRSWQMIPVPRIWVTSQLSESCQLSLRHDGAETSLLNSWLTDCLKKKKKKVILLIPLPSKFCGCLLLGW